MSSNRSGLLNKTLFGALGYLCAYLSITWLLGFMFVAPGGGFVFVLILGPAATLALWSICLFCLECFLFLVSKTPYQEVLPSRWAMPNRPFAVLGVLLAVTHFTLLFTFPRPAHPSDAAALQVITIAGGLLSLAAAVVFAFLSLLVRPR